MGPSKRRNSETEGAGRLRTVKRVSIMDFIVFVVRDNCRLLLPMLTVAYLEGGRHGHRLRYSYDVVVIVVLKK